MDTLVKQLKEEHIAELHARKNAIAYYEKQLYSIGQEANIAWYTYTCLEHGWEYCLQHGISIEQPTELAAYYKLVDFYQQEYRQLQEKRARYSKTVEALHEALTLFLAEQYNYDSHEPWELDIDGQKLIYKGTVLLPIEAD